jgi:hypothetical protein
MYLYTQIIIYKSKKQNTIKKKKEIKNNKKDNTKSKEKKNFIKKKLITNWNRTNALGLWALRDTTTLLWFVFAK